MEGCVGLAVVCGIFEPEGRYVKTSPRIPLTWESRSMGDYAGLRCADLGETRRSDLARHDPLPLVGSHPIEN